MARQTRTVVRALTLKMAWTRGELILDCAIRPTSRSICSRCCRFIPRTCAQRGSLVKPLDHWRRSKRLFGTARIRAHLVSMADALAAGHGRRGPVRVSAQPNRPGEHTQTHTQSCNLNDARHVERLSRNSKTQVIGIVKNQSSRNKKI